LKAGGLKLPTKRAYRLFAIEAFHKALAQNRRLATEIKTEIKNTRVNRINPGRINFPPAFEN
jgi:hypothetical protein